MGLYELDWPGSGYEQTPDSCVRGDELTALIKCWKFLDRLRNYQLFKKDIVS